MSKHGLQSPHHRFDFKEPDSTYYGGPKPDKDHLDRREDHTQHVDFHRDHMFSEGQRRSPVFSDDHHPFMRYHHSNQEETYHRRPPPHYNTAGYGDHQRLSPPRHKEDRGGHRGGFRRHSKGFHHWVKSHKSPLRIQREEMSSFHSDHRQREPRRREEQGGGWEVFGELGPGASSHPQKWEAGWERGRRNPQSSNRESQRGDSHRERSPLFRGQRRKLDDDEHHGYRNKEFEEQHHGPRDKFGRDAHGSLGPLIIEHDHGFRPHRKTERERFEEHRGHGSDDGRPRSSHPAERFRMSERSDSWEDVSGRQDDGRSSSYPDTRRNPVQAGRANTGVYGKHKGKTSFQARARGGRAGALRSQEASHGFPDPHQEPRSESRPFIEDTYKSPGSTDAVRHEDPKAEPWTSHRSRSLEPPPPDTDLDPKMPRQRMLEWNRPKSKNMTVVTGETLTIKVDMSRPVKKNSVLCYSSDRQLSLDLVNVGRQRLDFLPMLEHSGTFRETPTHTGTFAQEIITLVHHVKEQYFGGAGVTLNKRFSAPQEGGFSEDTEAERPTLNQRFSSSQGFSVNVKSLLAEEAPVFSSLLQGQPVRGPGDLRHDLERRRQERTEAVKVTITGSGGSQRPLEPAGAEFRDDDAEQVEPEEFSPLPAQHRRQEFNRGLRRGWSYRPFRGFQRRNYGNHFRPMRGQKRHFLAGPNS